MLAWIVAVVAYAPRPGALGHPKNLVRTRAMQPPCASCVAALDFDGVIVDSEPELTRTAWRAASKLWPELMEAAAELEPLEAGARKAWAGGQWGPLEGDGPDGLPNWLRAKMRLLRPVLETGFESILMIRLCVEEALTFAKSGSGQRPLTPGEITANWTPDLSESLLARYGLTREGAIDAFGGARDEWLADDLESWLAVHEFHEGAVAALRRAIDRGDDVYIVTTKEARFAKALLSSAGMHFDDDRIFGLGSGPKAGTLAELQERHPERSVAFVEDRIETLRSVCNDVSLFGCRLYFAGWGYSTPEQQAMCASMPRVQALDSSEELSCVWGEGDDAETR
jgi:phosphoglycolate phosphatase-like HAD superfamily hydrolase